MLFPRTYGLTAAFWVAGLAVSSANLIARQHYRFEHLSLEQGVAHNLASCIVQDSRGFIWFGTKYGLVRYDGYSYIAYRHNPDNPNSLSNDDIVSLLEDRQGNLWIGTSTGGLNKLVRATGQIVRFVHDPARKETISPGIVRSILEDHAEMLWIGTESGGLDRIDPATGACTHFRHDSLHTNSVSEDVVLSLIEDTLGNLWAGNRGSGVDRLDRSRTTVTHYRTDAGNPSSLSSNEVRKLYLDNEGVIWVCTSNGGVNKLTNAREKFIHYVHDPSNPNSISTDNVTTMIEDRSGIFWIGTPRGLNRLDPRKGTILRLYHESSEPTSLSSNEIVALIEDKSGLLWIGTYNGGVDKLYTGKRLFSQFKHNADDPASLSDNTVHSVVEDHAGNLWIGTNEGVNILRDSSGSFQRYAWNSNTPDGPDDNVVNAIAEDRLGIIWIGTNRGLRKMNRDGKIFAQYRHDTRWRNSLCDNVITSLHLDGSDDSELWIGTPGGLDRLNTVKETFVHYSHDEADSTALSSNFIVSMYEDRAGALWIGTNGGLNKFDSGRRHFKHFTENPDDPRSLSNNHCLTMLEDRSGVLWIGTGGGLNRFDGATGTFSHFMRNEGLVNGVVCGIVEEPPGTLWLSTYGGMSRFDTRAGQFTNYDVSDGLQSNMFSPGACLRRGNGNLVFGGINGFNVVMAGGIPRNPFVPPVVITSFMLFDNTNKDFTGSHPEFSSIELSYKENFFALAFAALDYTQPEKNQYAFKLQGFDEDWIHNGRTRFARYMNLSPGEYLFKVKGSNNDGVWNESGTELRIVITPPFWKTWWFYSITAVGVLALAAYTHVHRVRNKVNRLTEIERVRSAENKRVRKRAADDFHDEFGHKLTKISLLGQVIKRSIDGSAAERGEHLDKIIQTSNELSMGMRDFLWTLNPDKDSAYDVAIRLKDFGDELFNSSGIGFRVNGISRDLEHIQLAIDWRRHLTLMFKEAMNNVVKHSECRNATLDIVQRNGSIEITLTDDGKGFTNENSSPGQGLSSMRNRADKIRGLLNIRSERGCGTVVQFTGDIPASALDGGEKERA